MRVEPGSGASFMAASGDSPSRLGSSAASSGDLTAVRAWSTGDDCSLFTGDGADGDFCGGCMPVCPGGFSEAGVAGVAMVPRRMR